MKEKRPEVKSPEMHQCRLDNENSKLTSVLHMMLDPLSTDQGLKHLVLGIEEVRGPSGEHRHRICFRQRA